MLRRHRDGRVGQFRVAADVSSRHRDAEIEIAQSVLGGDVSEHVMGIARPAAAVIVATAAVVTRAVTGEDVNVVLFSGQQSTAHVLGLTSVGMLVVIAVAKTIAYTVSLGGGFRGGMVFPAVFLGVVVATALSLLVTGSSVSALCAAGIAASVAAVLRLPFTAVLLALLLCAAAGLAVTTPAIIGAVVGVLFRVVADARLHRDSPSAAKEPTPA